MSLDNRTPPKLRIIDFSAARSETPPQMEVSEQTSGKQTVRADDDLVYLRGQELRVPLASMVGFAELIASGGLTDEQRKLYAGFLVREGRRLDALVGNALALQRLETGHRDLNIGPMDVTSLLARAVLAAGEDVRRPIRVRMSKQLPLVAADAEAILEVLANFLSNARRFSPDGGGIEIGARQAGEMVAVRIQDHGVGIAADALPNMFRKFYRADSGVRKLGPGTGLGLAINHQIIAAHGGQVEAGSNGPGRGAHFQFTLPVLQPGAGAGDVLIVEDDGAFAGLMKAELGAAGISTTRAADAETAERVLKDATPRALILDLMLPGLQGEELLARMNRDGRAHLPVVVITVKDLTPVEISALEAAGAMAVLPKEAGAPQAAVALITDALALDRVNA